MERGDRSVKSQHECKSPRTRDTDVQRQEKMDVSIKKSELTLHPPFCSTHTLNRLDDAQGHW